MRIEQSTNNNLITLFIYLSIFINSFVFFTSPFEFYFGYLIYIILLPVFFKRYQISKQLLYIFSVLFITGLFNVFIGLNSTQQFFKVFTGLFLAYVFYYFVIIEYKIDIQRLFRWYLLGCYYSALIGLFQFFSFLLNFKYGYDYTWFLNKWGFIPGGNFGIRVNGLFGEPTYLAAVLSAAFFVSVLNVTRKVPLYITRFKSLIIMIVYILSFSGLGQTGIFISVILLFINFGLFRYVIILIKL